MMKVERGFVRWGNNKSHLEMTDGFAGRVL